MWSLNDILHTHTASRYEINGDYLLHSIVRPQDRYEYAEEDHSHWNKARTWIDIICIHAQIKRQGRGTLLLKSFLNTLPNGTGVVLNATPLDDIDMIPENKLIQWYISLGFQKIDKDNISLYKIL